MKKFKILSFLMIIVMIASFSGCGSAPTLEGDWVLVKEINADGSVWDRAFLEEKGVSEEYHISGEIATYVCYLLGKEITFDLEIVKRSNNTFDFMAGDTVFATGTLDGDSFSYVMEYGDGNQTFVYERKPADE